MHYQNKDTPEFVSKKRALFAGFPRPNTLLVVPFSMEKDL